MEYPNENMEEFFKNSLDRFNDIPSDSVWENLDKKLEDDKPFGKFRFWLRNSTIAAIMLLSFSGLYYQQYNLLDTYKHNLSQLTIENENLKKEVENHLSLLTSKSDKFDNEKSDVNAQFIGHHTQANLNRIQLLTDTIYIIKYIQPGLDKVNKLNTQFSFNPRIENTNYRFRSSDPIQAYIPTFNTLQNSNGTSTILKQTLPQVLSKVYTASNSFVYSESDEGVSTKMKYMSRNKSKRKRKKHKPAKAPVIVMDNTPWGKPEFYYRAGPSIHLLSSLKGELFSNSSIGLGYGFTQEVGLTDRFAITSGIYKNTQDYALNNNGFPLETNQISTFPNIENFNQSIVRVEIENKYLDIPVGAKYEFYKDNEKSLFINPAIKWSIHEPQTFNYFLTENRLQTFSSERRFGYLNALYMSIGIEKIINPFIRYQLSLGYDHSITKLGIEKQKLNTLTLRGNLLFGRN